VSPTWAAGMMVVGVTAGVPPTIGTVLVVVLDGLLDAGALVARVDGDEHAVTPMTATTNTTAPPTTP
jgi:hypothetical protein